MGDYELGNGRTKALVLAGPIFVTILFLVSLPMDGREIRLRDFVIMPLIMAIASPVGVVLALLPVLLLTKPVTFIAYRSPGLRHPAVWAMLGGAVIAPWLPWSDASSMSENICVALTGTGIMCALVCRSTVNWHD